MHQVIPRLSPDGRKKLCDGLEAHGTNLLFQSDYEFLMINPKNNSTADGSGARPGHCPLLTYKARRTTKVHKVLVE